MNLKKKKEGKWRVREDVFFFSFWGFFGGLLSLVVCVCVCVCYVMCGFGGGEVKGEGRRKIVYLCGFGNTFAKHFDFDVTEGGVQCD